MTRVSPLTLSLVFSCALAACGGEPPPPPVTPATPAPVPTAATPPPAPTAAAPLPAAWNDAMPPEQKVAFMKANVAPRMAKVFQGANAQHYAEFGCKTCHGPDRKDPKEFLPKLTMKGGKLTAFEEKPQIAKFMAEKVVPEMATALGMTPFNPATKTGFGCMGCHGVEMK